MALFRIGYKNQLTAVAASFLVPAVIVVGYFDTLPRPQAWWWFIWMVFASCFAAVNRWQAWRSQRQGEPDLAFVRRWRRHYLYQVCIIGFGWGNLGLLFVPGEAIQNAILMVIFLGVGAGAANTAGMHHLQAMYVGTSIAIFCQIFYLPYGFGERILPMQVILAFYLLVLLFAGRNVHRSVRESILLRFENEAVLQLKIQEAARADRANHDKSLFLAAASHDLRQPVHALLLLVTALSQRTLDPGQRTLVGHIQSAGQAISALFSALMELSRLESGIEKAEPGNVALVDLLRDVVNRHQLSARQKGLGLRLFIGRSLRRSGAWTDRILLGRIVDNLVSNAIRYTQSGNVLVALRLRNHGILFEVWDTGIGIGKDDQQRIFDPYVQLGNAERDRSAGLGLGLAIVRKTAELLGYEVEVRSQPGKGSVFRVHLCCVPADLQEPAQVGSAESQMPDLRGRRILLIDDDPMVLQATQIVLASWHAELKTALSGECCMDLLGSREWTPDCIICDYRLPGRHNGIELLDLLTQRFPQAAAILLTGELDSRVSEMAEDAGYILLAKPIPAEQLAVTLAAALPAVAQRE